MLCLFAVDLRHGTTWLAAVGVACTLSLLQVPCKHLGVAVPASKAVSHTYGVKSLLQLRIQIFQTSGYKSQDFKSRQVLSFLSSHLRF